MDTDARHHLIEAARSGDPTAIEQLLVQYQPDIRRFARMQCISTMDADDAVQETMWTVYQRIGALRTIAAFPGWIFSIVQHECFRLFRRSSKESELPTEELPAFACRPTDDLRHDLAAAIHSLPPKYAEVVLLRDFEEYSISEIAVALKLTREAVKSRIHRARQMIREYLLDG